MKPIKNLESREYFCNFLRDYLQWKLMTSLNIFIKYLFNKSEPSLHLWINKNKINAYPNSNYRGRSVHSNLVTTRVFGNVCLARMEIEERTLNDCTFLDWQRIGKVAAVPDGPKELTTAKQLVYDFSPHCLLEATELKTWELGLWLYNALIPALSKRSMHAACCMCSKDFTEIWWSQICKNIRNSSRLKEELTIFVGKPSEHFSEKFPYGATTFSFEIK